MRHFLIKLFNWEYWPQWVVYMPLAVYYLYLSLRARSFFFFSAANPGIETGGMFFESKWDVLQLIPSHLYPSTILVKEGDSTAQIMMKMREVGIGFPVIAKPDRGERGWCVQKITNETELEAYKSKTPITFLVQRYVEHPIELSVFYVRHPNAPAGRISSVTYKKLLSITGDGRSTVKELILTKDRAYLQKEVLFPQLGAQLERVLAAGEELLLVPYGNHVRGAEFRNFDKIIDQQLAATFDTICREIPHFFYGRFDLRVKSIDSLKQGKDIAILELNGAGAEPAHIYDPCYRFISAQRDLFWHYRQMFDIAMHNKKNGTCFMTLAKYLALKKMEKAYKKLAA